MHSDGGGPEGGGGACLCFCSDLKGGSERPWGEHCLCVEFKGCFWGGALCSFCSAEWAGTGGGFPAGRALAYLDRVEGEGLGWGEGFLCVEMHKKTKFGYVNYYAQETQKSSEKTRSSYVFTKWSWPCFFNKNAGLAWPLAWLSARRGLLSIGTEQLGDRGQVLKWDTSLLLHIGWHQWWPCFPQMDTNKTSQFHIHWHRWRSWALQRVEFMFITAPKSNSSQKQKDNQWEDHEHWKRTTCLDGSRNGK